MRDASGHTESSKASSGWGAIALATAATLFWAATSDAVYDATSPPGLSWHVALRKAYSIAAFALVGFMADNALGAHPRALVRGALLVALYSASIELVQAHNGSHEGLAWNAIDVACGAIGGALGVLAAARIRRSRRRT